MSLKRRKKGILPAILMLTMLFVIVSIMTKYVQAKTVTADQMSSQYLNSVKKFLNMGDQRTSTFNFNIKNNMKKDGATYTWYIRMDKGNPGSIKIDKKTGVVTAVEAGTAYIRCKVTLADGTILRPEAIVTVRNNITEVAISNIPKTLSVEAGKKTDFNRSILNTSAGKSVKTKGITRWEIANDTAGVGTVTSMGEVIPLKEGEFQIRAICFQSNDKYKLWLADKAANKGYMTATSKWVTIKVAPSKETAMATTQDELVKLLQSDDIVNITVKTDAEVTFVIPKGDYSSKTLIVDAKNADVENYGIFKDIIIKAIKDHTWIEFVDGNIIYLSDDTVSVVIDKDAKVKRIVIDRPNSNVNLDIRGTVEQINVLQPSNIDIKGSSQNVPVTVEESAGGSYIQASIPLNLVFKADTEIKLNKGAEGTVLDKSEGIVEVKIENNTEKPIVITTDKDSGETVGAGDSAISYEAPKQGGAPTQSLTGLTAISHIIGIPKVGVELSAGAVSPAEATVSYQWKISASEDGAYTDIAGANSAKYTPVDSDQGKYIKVAAIATGSYTGTVTSEATAAVSISEVKLQEAAEMAVDVYESTSITSIVEIVAAENLKVPADTAVNAVGDAIAKAAFQQRITDRAAIITEARAELEAEAAIVIYEIAPITTLSEVTAAESLKAATETAVSAVSDTAVKTVMQQRITDIVAAIAKARTELEAGVQVAAYEMSPITTLTEVTAAESLKAAADTAVSALGDSAVKTALQQRITDRSAVIAEARAELEAEIKVAAYEVSPITTLTEVTAAEGLKAAADTAVSVLGNITVKTALQHRITDRAAVITEARAELEAEAAIVLYEISPLATLTAVTAAEGLKVAADTAVFAVGDSSVKTALLQRITDRAAVIAQARAELEAEAAANVAVAAYEVAPITTLSQVSMAEGLKSAAETAVSAVGDPVIKTILEQRITDRAVVIADARAKLEAEAAVILAENSNAQDVLDTAQALVLALPDGGVKESLQIKINAVQDIITADIAVHAAETSTTQSDVDSAQILVTALPDGTAKTALQNRINTVQGIINDAIAAEANALSVAHAKVAIESSVYSMTQAVVGSEADVKAAIETIIAGLDLEGVAPSVAKLVYTPAIAGSEGTPNGTNGTYTFTVSLSKGAGATLALGSTGSLSMNITATVYVPPEIITSMNITNFNFATIESSTATLVSKPMATSDFSGANERHFTITDGAGNVIPVDLYWNITTDQGFSVAALVGSGIESYIQDYFNAHGGLDIRTLWAASFAGDTFTLSSFAQGVLNKITIGGPDGSYFFDSLYAQGTDLDTSANRTFSISDGTNSANIILNSDLTNMDKLVSAINSKLSAYYVQAVAVKISEGTFKIVGNNITVDGNDKAEFFSTFVSE